MEMNDSVIEQQRYIRLDSKQMACIAANLKKMPVVWVLS